MAKSQDLWAIETKGKRKSTNVIDLRGQKPAMPQEWRTEDEIIEDEIDDMLFEARATKLFQLRQKALNEHDTKAAKRADWEEKDLYREANDKFKKKFIKRLQRQANGRLD